MFDQFWNACKRKVGKAAARKAFDRQCKTHDAETIIEAMEVWSTSNHASHPVLGRLHPSTWLNQERFLDDQSIWFETDDGPTTFAAQKRKNTDDAFSIARRMHEQGISADDVYREQIKQERQANERRLD